MWSTSTKLLFLLFKKARWGRFMAHRYNQWASDLIESGQSPSCTGITRMSSAVFKSFRGVYWTAINRPKAWVQHAERERQVMRQACRSPGSLGTASLENFCHSDANSWVNYSDDRCRLHSGRSEIMLVSQQCTVSCRLGNWSGQATFDPFQISSKYCV